MRKLCVICLFLTVLFAFSVNAKVCFLPGVFAGDGCIEGEVSVGCSGFERTSPCPSNYNQETCSDNDNGRTYYRCTCKSNNIPMPDSRYRCLGSYDSSCGCAASETVCNTNIYPYENCDAYAGTVANSDFCADPSTGKRHYKSCDCPESIYPYDCKETGLKESRLAQKCKDSSGKTAYSYCDCIDSWTTEPCSENSSGCNTLLDDAYRGGNMGYCYSCGPATCANAQEKNLMAVFCSVTPTTNTNCYSLGYTTLDNGTGLCADGTEGVKCIFDSKYMFCEGQLSGDNISECTDEEVFFEGECWIPYESCEKAGYQTQQITFNEDDYTYLYCYDTVSVPLKTGSICYDNCVTAYDSCEELGYASYQVQDMGYGEYLYCYDNTASIILSDGSQTTCYDNCVAAYDSCEDVGLYTEDFALDSALPCNGELYSVLQPTGYNMACCEKPWVAGTPDEFGECILDMEMNSDLNAINDQYNQAYCMGLFFINNGFSGEKCLDTCLEYNHSSTGCEDGCAWYM